LKSLKLIQGEVLHIKWHAHKWTPKL
jgi:hypothetical protein